MPDHIIRRSQLITTYGPGAMIDLPDHSVIVAGLQDWMLRRPQEIREPRLTAKLRRALNLPDLKLYPPPPHEEDAKDHAPVGVRIFPTWFIVKDAQPSPGRPWWRRRRLVRWFDLSRRRFPDEDGERKPVVPVRFVCGCRRGHLDDLDWWYFIHQSGVRQADASQSGAHQSGTRPASGPAGAGRRACERPLWLEERGTSGDIAETWAVCGCGAERTLFEAFGAGTTALGRCRGKRPWLGQFADEECQETYRLLVRTASNSYFPQTMSVISLPEVDAGLAAKVTEQYERLKTTDDLGMLDRFRTSPELDAAFADVDEAAVLAEFRRQKAGARDAAIDVPVKAAEFAILDKGAAHIGDDAHDSTFLAETLPRADWDPGGPLLEAIDKVVLVHRLREVVSLLGFTRFEAVNPDKDGEFDLGVERAALAETIRWLPAIENRGEGVFASFRPAAVVRWLDRVAASGRGRQIEAGWTAWAKEHQRNPEQGFPGLPYLMLHSVSHMLMTAIALDCGYPVSSLRERVYAGKDGFGILIYTASSDAEGTLGGLVDTGRRFAAHLRGALARSRLCSNDPVCAEHRPDAAYESRPLQGAACHGCLLIAETSCEQRNDFLDRALVLPTVGEQEAAFFEASAIAALGDG